MMINITFIIFSLTHACFLNYNLVNSDNNNIRNNNCIRPGELCVYTDDNPCCNKSTICRNIKRGYEENVSVCLSPALYRDYCQYDTDCLRLDFAKCNTKYNECECLPNYWASANHRRCVPLIGGYCVHKQDCLVDNSICIGNKCQCKESFVMKSNKLCALTSIGKSCKKDIDCSDILHIGCSVSKKCVCKNNHILVDNSMCVPLLDEFCWTDELCAPNNSICFNNKCKCKPNYIAVANTHCYEPYIGKPCESNQDCKNILHSVCSEHGVCICDDNYVVVNRDKCVPLIDGACSSNKECRIENSVCVDNKCQCGTNYSSLNNNKCILVKK